MALLTCTHQPFLQTSAQLLVLPVSSDGTLLDPVLARCKNLYPDNYKTYRQACLDGVLHAGQCLLIKRQLERSGLGASTNGNGPSHIANLTVTDNPYHPTRRRWLSEALHDMHTQLFKLIRYDGLRRISLLARPLIYAEYTPNFSNHRAELRVPILDWQADIYPLITEVLGDLPKIRIDVHVPKSVGLD